MKNYFSDKNGNPWHKVFSDIEKYWPAKDKDGLEETLLVLRGAVFASFDMLSASVVSDLSTQDVLDVFLKKKDWNEARKSVRQICADSIRRSILNGETRFLQASALKRDGFAYLVGHLEEKKWQLFRDAQPSIKRGKLDLTKLESTEIGSRFLKEQGVSELKLSKDDQRVPLILEAYEHYLIEYEVDTASIMPIPLDTEQVTLNGTPIETDKEKPKKTPKSASGKDDSIQAELSDFFPPEEPKKKKPAAAKKSKTTKKQKERGK